MNYLIRFMLIVWLVSFSSISMADEWFYPVGDPENRSELRVTQPFMQVGHSNNVYSDKVHLGTDIGVPRSGTYSDDRTIRAISRGRVVYVGTGDNSGWGNTVVLRHAVLNAGRYVFSSYSHLNSISVNKGELVQGGQPIGVMGSTGNSTATHLHFQVLTKDNGFNLWDNFSTADLGISYIANSNLPSGYQNGYLYNAGNNIYHYDGILFVDFMRAAVISPPSVQRYSINGDSSATAPFGLRVSQTNTVEIDVATFRENIGTLFMVRDYSGNPIAGAMSLVNSGTTGWIMDDSYNPLGSDLGNGGWNSERLLTYRFTFTPSIAATDANLAIFWKPDTYNSSYLILPIPGGVAYNTIRNTGRYVFRPIVQ